MVNTIFKEIIYYIDYKTIVSIIYRMDTSDSIKKVKVEISKWGKNVKFKNEVKAVSNARINIRYVEYNQPV